MTWLLICIGIFYVLMGLAALGLVVGVAVEMFRVKWDDGPPDVHGDVPHVPPEARK